MWFGAILLLLLGAPARAVDRSAPADRTPFLVFPMDPLAFRLLTSDFGDRVMDGEHEHHSGLDLAAPQGTVVIAARGGTVARVGYDTRAGWHVRITHDEGWSTIYCHLLRDPGASGLRAGAQVRAGEPIGVVGSTGRSTGPHLHFSVTAPDGQRVDPRRYLMTPQETWELFERLRARDAS